MVLPAAFKIGMRIFVVYRLAHSRSFHSRTNVRLADGQKAESHGEGAFLWYVADGIG